MKLPDLHEEFLNTLSEKYPKKSALTNIVSDVLRIEKESAYRRLSGKVSFSVREVGIIAKQLGISLDALNTYGKDQLLLPFNLENAMQSSMDVLLHIMTETIVRLERMTCETVVAGNVYNSIPVEFFLYSPELSKFMLFKWGHYFVGGDEFNDYRSWKIPSDFSSIQKRTKDVYQFKNIYYIWDDGLIWTYLNEVANLYKMRIIDKQNKNDIKEALKDMLTKLEQTLSGNYVNEFGIDPDIIDFYACSRSSGVSCNYYMTENHDQFFAFLQTNFSHCLIDNDYDNFCKMKAWVDSFKRISTMLSRSGRMERRIFFDTQLKLVDLVLNSD